MIKGLFKSASAMLPQAKRQEVIANNLANVSTPGFKKDAVFTRELNRAQERQAHRKARADWQTPMIDQVYTRFQQGDLEQTDNPLDLALESDGFFVLQAEDGSSLLTRAGNFIVDSQGFISTPEGHHLMGDGGPISVIEGSTVVVSENGQIEADGAVIGNLQVVEVEDRTALVKAGKNSFTLPEGEQPVPITDFAVRQGFLETSNIDIVREMVDMIISFRMYEADAQSLKIQDNSLEKLINNVGQTR
jgi:flagellar basal-body rod protein FlgF